jgi:hypothetical protein
MRFHFRDDKASALGYPLDEAGSNPSFETNTFSDCRCLDIESTIGAKRQTTMLSWQSLF